jgi:hypothetical protein
MISGTAAASLETLTSMFSKNKVASTTTIDGGGIVGVLGGNTLAAADSIGGVSDTGFSENTVTGTDLRGGGVVGVASVLTVPAAAGEVGNVNIQLAANDRFNKNTVTLNSISGGGVMGTFTTKGLSAIGAIRGAVSATSAGMNSAFDGNTVMSTTTIDGGGVVGIRGGDLQAAADVNAIGEISNTRFDSNVVTGTDLRGGGVAGVASILSAQAMPSTPVAPGNVQVGTATGDRFTGNTVTLNSINGGGVLGTYTTKGTSLIGVINGAATASADDMTSAFDDNNVTSTTIIDGGGVVGIRGGDLQSADVANAIGEMSNTRYEDNIVRATVLRGGGVVGIASILTTDPTAFGAVHIQKADSNRFIGNDVAFDSIDGGGVLGTFTTKGPSTIGAIGGAPAALPDAKTSAFDGNTVVSDTYIDGGGVIGIRGASTLAAANVNGIGDISNTRFSGNEVTTPERLRGGGVVGIASILSDTPLATEFGGIQIGTAASDWYENNTVTSEYVSGGGILGTYTAKGATVIGAITGTSAAAAADMTSGFAGNTVRPETWIDGGGIVGIRGGDTLAADNANAIGEISDTRFSTNSVVVPEDLRGGGVVGIASILAGPAEFGRVHVDSVDRNRFIENEVSARSISGGGVIGTYTTQGLSTIGKITGTSSATSDGMTSAFDGNDVTSKTTIEGGGVVGIRGVNTQTDTDANGIGEISDTRFATNTVNATDLWGGGIVGIATMLSDPVVPAEIGNNLIEATANNRFVGNTVDFTSINGGGIVGTYTTEGFSSIGSITGTAASSADSMTSEYSGNKVTSATIIDGGGVVGIRGGDTKADGADQIGEISDTLFSTNTVTATDMRGGGVVGIASILSNPPLATEVGNVHIQSADRNRFNGNVVTVNSLGGGGVVGTYTTKGQSYIAEITGTAAAAAGDMTSVFQGNRVTSATTIDGGGVVGIRGGDLQSIEDANGIEIISDTRFSTNNVKAAGALRGGGVVGVASILTSPTALGHVMVGSAIGDRFIDNTVDANSVSGGGVLGLYTTEGLSAIKAIAGEPSATAEAMTSVFQGNKVTSETIIDGGGIVGIRGVDTPMTGSANFIDVISDSRFSTNEVTAANDLRGGGVVGIASILTGPEVGNVHIGAVTADRFIGNTVRANSFVGGGVLGIYTSQGLATIDSITSVPPDSESPAAAVTSAFQGNKVTSIGIIDGGGVVGVRGGDTQTASNGIGEIADTVMSTNSVIATDLRGGGVVGIASILSDPAVASEVGNVQVQAVDGDSFIDNVIGVNSISGGGILGTYTTKGISSIGEIKGGSSATADGMTSVFQGNKVVSTTFIDGGGVVGIRGGDTLSDLNANSIGDLSDTRFSANDVSATGGLRGGGVAGIASILDGATATGHVLIRTATNDRFIDNTVGANSISGGGIFGTYTTKGLSAIGTIGGTPSATSDGMTSVYQGNKVTSATTIDGGGIIGIRGADTPETSDGLNANYIVEISGTGFSANNVTSTQGLRGGGVVGIASLPEGNEAGNAVIGQVSNDSFAGNTVKANSIGGGGVVGIFTPEGLAAIYKISGTVEGATDVMASVFQANVITSDTVINGGGIVGIRASDTPTNYSNGIEEISDTGFDKNVVKAASGIRGGGVVGIASITSALADFGNTVIESVLNGRFTGNDVAAGFITGGGVLGLDSPKGTSFVSVIKGVYDTEAEGRTSTFDGNKVTSAAEIEGGGVIGIRGGAPEGGDTIVGGGAPAVGVGEITYTDFTGNAVTASGAAGDIRGGGVVGVASVVPGSSADQGDALIGKATNDRFVGNEVDARSISGGGIMGTYSTRGSSVIGEISASGDEVPAPPAGDPAGSDDSAVQPAQAEQSAPAVLAADVSAAPAASASSAAAPESASSDDPGVSPLAIPAASEIQIASVFEGNTVESATFIEGGGIVGVRGGDTQASPDKTVGIGKVSDTLFSTNKVDAQGALRGGGIVGIASVLTGTDERATGKVNAQSVSGVGFIDNEIQTNSVSGGGILGAYSSKGATFIGEITGVPDSDPEKLTSVFSGNKVTSDTFIDGGGIVGVDGGNAVTGGDVKVGIGNLTNTSFTGNEVVADGGTLRGGGIVGVVSSLVSGGTSAQGNLTIDNVINDRFVGNSVEAHAIHGGGILGAYSEKGVSYIGTITGIHSTDYEELTTFMAFDENTVKSDTFIDGGGIIGIKGSNATTTDTALAGFHEISNASFMGNTVTADSGRILGGLIYSAGLYDLEAKISDSEFIANTFTSNYGSSGGKVYGAVTIDTGIGRANDGTDAAGFPYMLTIEATQGNTTLFTDNQIVENGKTRTNSLYIGSVLSVDDSANSNTVNNVPAEDFYLVIDAYSDDRSDENAIGRVFLYDPIEVMQANLLTGAPRGAFQMDINGNGGSFYWGGLNTFVAGNPVSPALPLENSVNFHPGSFTFLMPGMHLDAPSHDFNTYTGSILQVQGWDFGVTDPEEAYNPNVLNVQNVDFQGELHFLANGMYMNSANHPLLIINSPNPVHIEDDLVTVLAGFMPTNFNPGDGLVLIDTGYKGGIANPNGDYAAASNGVVSVYRNSITYNNFIGDSRADLIAGVEAEGIESDVDEANYNQYYVLRFISSTPAPPVIIVPTTYAAGTAHAATIGTWLPDHSYQQADLNIRQEDSWAIFGGVDGSRYSVVEGSRVDLAGVTALIGVARKSTHRHGVFLGGAFIEGGFFKYDVDGFEVPGTMGQPDTGFTVVGGKGETKTVGIGLMARETFNNRLRVEASARIGRLYNSFDSQRYFVNEGWSPDYDTDTTYYGGHLGLGYTKLLNDVSNLDFVVRGYFTRVEGSEVRVDSGEVINFHHTDSKRLRGGIRYTRQSSENVFWYAGGYYDYEFDHKVKAKTDGIVVGAPDMKGGTGIFEIGVETHPSKNHEKFSFGFGFQGYVGELRGISGGVRIGYEF